MDINKTCWNVVRGFDYGDDMNPFEDIAEPPGLGSFFYDLIIDSTKTDPGLKDLTEKEKEIIEEAVLHLYFIPFAFGYVFGQMFDIPSPEIQKEIDKIKKLLRQKALLPYLPREKKGGCHEK